MSRLLLVTAACAMVLLAGCCGLPDLVVGGIGQTVTGSGNLITVEKPLEDFSRVDVSHAFQAEVIQGDTYSVVITIDDNLEQYLVVEQVGDTLRVGLEQDRLLGLNNTTLKARVTMPTLTGVNASGASRVKISGFASSKNLDVEVSGASALEGDIDAGDVRVEASGASRVDLTGQGQDGRIGASGASQVHMGNFRLTNVDVEASGASQAEVYASGVLNADASGASTVRYSGNPTLGQVESSGAGRVTPR